MRGVCNDLRTTHIDPLITVHESTPQLLISAPKLTAAEKATLTERFERLSGKSALWEPAVEPDSPRKPHKRKHPGG